MTGIESANWVLYLAEKEKFEVQNYPPPEPLAAWIESLIMRSRKGEKEKLLLVSDL